MDSQNKGGGSLALDTNAMGVVDDLCLADYLSNTHIYIHT
jgi:hypothetical protein